MQTGTRELTRSAATYLACLVFAITFLVCTVFGATGLTSVWRGAVSALVTLVVGNWLVRPAVGVVLDAMARDRVRMAEADAAEQAAREEAIAAAKARRTAE